MSTWRAGAVVAGLVLALATSGCSLGVEERFEEPETRRLELTVADATDGRCMMPTADVIARAEVAFEGTVIETSGETARLEVSRWIHGEGQAPEVVVTATDLSATSELGVEFEEGKTYLVSATGSQVTLCGFSGPKTDELSALYDEAFAH
ncbi:MAG: hypothetical protein ACI379_08275 [Nocardioides sp.]|uniref:hypothetical protein n=1 Tax=Nocardioides sp. TaxID=35761 RepID=UPI003F12BFBE